MSEAPKVFAQATRQAEDSMVHDTSAKSLSGGYEVAAPESYTDTFLSEISIQLARLESVVSVLEKRISRVLTPEPGASPTDSSAYTAQSALNATLEELGNIARYRINHLESIIQRIDL